MFGANVHAPNELFKAYMRETHLHEHLWNYTYCRRSCSVKYSSHTRLSTCAIHTPHGTANRKGQRRTHKHAHTRKDKCNIPDAHIVEFEHVNVE